MFDLIALGGILEYFDFISFSLIYPHIGFIKYSRQSLNFGAQFALGFGGRFIGSLLVLILRKQFNEQKILIISIWIMTISTSCIVLLPNYFFSFYILLLLRLMQGIAFAVEFPIGALINSPSAINGATQGYIIALTCYNLIFSYIPYKYINLFAWKIPFILGGAGGIFLLIQRRKFSITTIPFNTIANNALLIIRISQLIFVMILGYNVIQHKMPRLEVFQMPEINSYLTIIPILYFISKLFIKYKWFKRITSVFLYIFLLQNSIRCSSGQAYLVSHHPNIASIHIIALLSSIIIVRLADYKILGYKIEDIVLFLYIIDIILASLFGNSFLYMIHNQLAYFGHLGIILLLCIGQIITTICINKSLYIIKNVLKKHKYLVPLAYNLVAATAFLGFEMNQLKFKPFNSAHYHLLTRISSGLIGFICKC